MVRAAKQGGIDGTVERLPKGTNHCSRQLFESWQNGALVNDRKWRSPRPSCTTRKFLFWMSLRVHDVKAEAEFFERLHELAKERTSILISQPTLHRQNGGPNLHYGSEQIVEQRTQ